MAKVLTTPVIGVNLAQVDDTPVQRIGTTVETNENGQFEYVYSACGLTAGQAAVINGCGSAFPATTALAVCMKKIGIAQNAIACGKYGWLARRGYGLNCNLVASAGATAQLYTTATAGALGTTLVTAALVAGAVSVTAASAGGTTLAAVSLGASAVTIASAPGA